MSYTIETYFDRFGFVHDKPTDGDKASSGNPGIYTAYYVMLSGGGAYRYEQAFYKEMVRFDGTINKPA